MDTLDMLTTRLTRSASTSTDFSDLKSGRTILDVPTFDEIKDLPAKVINKRFVFHALKRIEVPAEVEAHFRAVELEWLKKEFGPSKELKPNHGYALEAFICLLENGFNVFTKWERYGRRKMLTVAGEGHSDPGYVERKVNRDPGKVKQDFTMTALRNPLPYDNSADGGPAYYRVPGTKCGKGIVKRASKKRIAALKALMAAHTDLMFFFRRPAGSENLDNLSSAGCTDMMRRLNNLIADSEEMNKRTEIVAEPVKESAVGEKWMEFILSLALAKGYANVTPESIMAMTRKAAYELTEKLKAMPDMLKPVTPGNYRLNGSIVRVVSNKAGTGMYCFVDGVYAENSRSVIASLTDEMRIAEEIAPVAPKGEVEPGVFKHEGTLYRVVWNRSKTSKYVYELNENDDNAEYVGKRPFAFLTEDMRLSVEERAEWGKRTGTCMDCARTLTNKISIENGIGPICASR